MGFRHRFAFVDACTVDAVRNLSTDDLKKWLHTNNPKGLYSEEGKEYFVVYDLLNQTEFFDFGKDCQFAHDLIRRAQPLFTNAETQHATDNIMLCTAEDFQFVIEQFRLLIHEYFKVCMNYPYEEMKLHFKDKAEEWGNLTDLLGLKDGNPIDAQSLNARHYPYNMDESSDTIVQSWLYEYQIFELVRLYKQFDWKQHALLFYGW